MKRKFEYYAERFELSMFLASPKKQKKLFDELGRKGWELVSVVPIIEPVIFTSVPVTKSVLGYFKRAIK